jgi:hypothetical protein
VIEFSLSNTGIGTYQTDEVVYQGYSLNSAIATGKVVNYANNKLYLTDLNGNFLSSRPIIGSKTKATYNYTTYNERFLQYSQITVTANTLTSNANSPYIYTTTIEEYPDIS